MLEIFKIFILSTIIITLWTAFLLLQDKRSNTKLNRWFAMFLFALTTPQMDLYAAHIVPGGIPLLSFVASTFLWLKGPFIWIFLTVLVRKEINPKKIWIHFIPWFSALISLQFFPQLIKLITLLGMSQMLIYLLAALSLLISKRLYITEIYQEFKNTAYYWLLYVIGGLTLLITIDFIVMSLVASGLLKTYNFLDYAVLPTFSIYVLSIGIFSVYRPEFLFRKTVNTADKSTSDISTFLEETFNSPTTEKYLQNGDDTKIRYLELDVALAQTLSIQLTNLMQSQQLYRKNELSLPDLAQSLGISTHQLSELLNVHLDVNFYDYINGYRLELAASLLRNSNCHLRILDIAFEAGFNNKNSFYRAFKESFGVTPNQYRDPLKTIEVKFPSLSQKV